MLPSIVDIARQHNLTLIQPKGRSKEMTGKCPFCRADEGRRDKHYLSLNIVDNVFRCWHCAERGGVCRFEALLTGIPESEVTDKYRRNPERKSHPAEKLTLSQLRLINFDGMKKLQDMKKRNPAYYKRTLDWVWSEWKQFVEEEKQKAFQLLLVSIFNNNYTKGITLIQDREQEIGTKILDELLRVFSLSQWPAWAIEAKQFALAIGNPSGPFELSQEERSDVEVGIH